MSLEKIIERIQNDAQNQVNEIKDRASAAADEIIEKAKADAGALRAQIVEKAKSEAEQRKQRIISTARLDFRKSLLAEKQKAIDAAFQGALGSLINMESAKYQEILKNMILVNIHTGHEEVILSKRDRARLGDNLVRAINRQLSKSGKKASLTLSKDTYDIQGGFVLRRGKIELNSSFESLFKSFRGELESEVSKILFEFKIQTIFH